MGVERYIAKQFGNPSGLGGRMVSAVMNRQNRPLYEAAAELLRLSNEDAVLDIGYGNGYMLNMLARRHNCAFTGIDASPSIVGAAARRNRAFVETGRMRLMCQNANGMSFANSSFDKAYTVNTVYFWENPDGIMLEIRRVLKPGGLFINALYSNATLSRFGHTRFGYRHFTPDQLMDAGRRAGFTASITPVLDAAAYCVLYKGNL